MSEVKITVKPSLQHSPRSNVETESETIDDFSQYSNHIKEQISSDSRSGTPILKHISSKNNRNNETFSEVIESNQSQNEERDNLDDVMVEISKKTTIKKIISRTTAVNGITQATEVEESLIQDSHQNDYSKEVCSKLANSARLQDRRRSSVVNFSNNTTGRKDSHSSSSSESIGRNEAPHYFHSSPGQNKRPRGDRSTATERRNSMPEYAQHTKSTNKHPKKRNDKNMYNKPNTDGFTVNEHEKKEPSKIIYEKIPITKSENAVLVRENDKDMYPKSNTGEYIIGEDTERKERSSKYERTPFTKSSNKAQNRGNDDKIYHKQRTGEYIIDEPKIRTGRNEKDPLTESANRLGYKEQKPRKFENVPVIKSLNGPQTKGNDKSIYHKTNVNNDTDRKEVPLRIPIGKSQNSFSNRDNEDNPYQRTRTDEDLRNKNRAKERKHNTTERDRNRKKEEYHKSDDMQNNRSHISNKVKHLKYEESLRPYNNPGYIKNTGQRNGDDDKLTKMKNNRDYNDEHPDRHQKLKESSAWNKKGKKNKIGHDKSILDKDKYFQSGGTNTKVLSNGTSGSPSRGTPIKWIDPSKSDHLKYDSKNNRMQHWIKEKRSSLSRSDPNSQMNGSANSSMTPSGSVGNTSEPYTGNNFHKNIKEYIIRGNIKEDLYQKRHSRHNQAQQEDPFGRPERHTESESFYYPDYIHEINSSPSTKLREHRHDDLSNQISKILKKFDLMEKQIQFKSNSFEAIPQNMEDNTLSCRFQSSCCHHSHLHCCLHCCHFWSLNSERYEPLDRSSYRPIKSQSHSLSKTRNYSKSYEHISDIYRNETPLSLRTTNSIDGTNNSSPLNGVRSSHMHLHHKHIKYLENKLDSLEKKLENLKFDQQRTNYNYKEDLVSQCQAVERQLKSLYKTIPT